MDSRYKRILLKLSGEAIAGKKGFGIDPEILGSIAEEIKSVYAIGVQIALIIGGGNIFRGISDAAKRMNRVSADTVGMLATVINSLLLKESLVSIGVKCKVLSAAEMKKVAEFYTPQKAIEYMDNGYIIIIAGGTGNPYFTTDTAAALRCAETECDIILKATKVDGIYDSDPVKNPDAKKIESLTHKEALKRDIRVMDATAFSLCMENSIPIKVFKLSTGNLIKCIEGKSIGSSVITGD